VVIEYIRSTIPPDFDAIEEMRHYEVFAGGTP
jgi:hypothetical protein